MATTSSDPPGLNRSVGVTITAGRSLPIPFVSATSAHTMRPVASASAIATLRRLKRVWALPLRTIAGADGDFSALHPNQSARRVFPLPVGLAFHEPTPGTPREP